MSTLNAYTCIRPSLKATPVACDLVQKSSELSWFLRDVGWCRMNRLDDAFPGCIRAACAIAADSAPW
jgi:hypothetical protein